MKTIVVVLALLMSACREAPEEQAQFVKNNQATTFEFVSLTAAPDMSKLYTIEIWRYRHTGQCFAVFTSNGALDALPVTCPDNIAERPR